MAMRVVQLYTGGLYHLISDDGDDTRPWHLVCKRRGSWQVPWYPGDPAPDPARYCLLCAKRGDFAAAKAEHIREDEERKAAVIAERAARVARYGQNNVALDMALNRARRGVLGVGFLKDARVSDVVGLHEDAENPELTTGVFCEIDGVRMVLRAQVQEG